MCVKKRMRPDIEVKFLVKTNVTLGARRVK